MAVCYGSDVAERAQAARDTAADKADARELAYCSLQVAAIKAMESGNAAALIPSPGWGKHNPATLDDVLCDAIADAETWRAIVALIGTASSSKDASTRIPAQALIARIATAHAAFHVDDLLAQQAGEFDAEPPARRLWRAK